MAEIWPCHDPDLRLPPEEQRSPNVSAAGAMHAYMRRGERETDRQLA